VPLLLRLPHAEHAGAVVATPVSLLDVAPTIAAVANVPIEAVQGRSLLPLIGANEVEDAPVFFGAQAGESAVRLGRFKLLRRGEKSELFDLEADPGERVDVASQRPEVVRALTALIDARLDTDRALARQHARGGDVSISDSERKRMEAIGYQ
jgi:arylsulfatase A-like enzyme